MAIALMILQVLQTEAAGVPTGQFYTTENLISVLILIISISSSLVIWFVNKAIHRAEKRDEKIDEILAQMRQDITKQEKHTSMLEFGYATVDKRLEKLETWKEEMQRNHHT